MKCDIVNGFLSILHKARVVDAHYKVPIGEKINQIMLIITKYPL